MRKIKTWRNPYDEGWSVCRLKQIELMPGLTVLVGCNGAGKTTLLHNIRDELKKEKVPCATFDNLKDGGSYSISAAAFHQDYELMATMWTASEGEQIGINVGQWSSSLRYFIEHGRAILSKTDKIADSLMEEEEKIKRDEEFEKHKERWLLLDATDSGLSIDKVIDLKDLLKCIIEDGKETFDKDVYIVISANEYELARGEQCYDVNVCKYLTFPDYEKYRKFIIKSREKKEKRYDKED